MEENIRLLVQEEGRTARNLVAFHVPIDVGLTLPNSGKTWARKPPVLPRSINDTKKPNALRPGQRMLDSSAPVKRIRSASTGRDKKSELQARYWAYLFGNLERAVNEIYSTCEADESVTECKEAILVLENYTREFISLIEWFQVKSAYENTAAPQRPNSLTWDVRKSSPGKVRSVDSKMDPSQLTNAKDLTSQFAETLAHLSQDSASNGPESLNDVQADVCTSPQVEDTSLHVTTSASYDREVMHSQGKDSQAEVGIMGSEDDQCLLADESYAQDHKDTIEGELSDNVQLSACSEMLATEKAVSVNSSDVGSASADARDPRSDIECNQASPTGDVCGESAAKTGEPEKQMVSEASQTDLEVCVQDADGLRFIPQSSAKAASKPARTATALRKPNYAAVSRLGPSRFSRAAPVVAPLPRPTARPQVPRQPFNSLASRVHPKSAPARSKVMGQQPVPPLDRHSQCSLSSSSTSVRSWADKLRRDSVSFHQSTVSVEVLPRAGTANQDGILADDQQGWETVKGRSRSRWSPSTSSKAKLRFNQLSASSSLPALALSEVEVRLPRNLRSQLKKPVTHDAKRNKEKENSREKRKSDANVKAIDEFNNEVEEIALDNNAEIFEDILAEELRLSRELSFQEARLRQEILELEAEEQTKGEQGSEIVSLDSDALEARYENVLSGMSWAERMDTLEELQEYVARNPGRATELHQKLSSPSRRRTVSETLRRFQAKQALAKEKREELGRQRTARLKELHNKVEEVKAAQEENTAKRKLLLDTKLKRAEANRQQHLKGIVKKAHDEEQKLKEIAFITELETQNKRHDFMALCQEQEERLQGIADERQRKQEEKAAKEAAVEERRRVLEAERQVRLERMQELRREREERVGRAQQEKEKERQELAREKARDREERLSALHAAQLANQEELQKKIRVKQEESARRHEENMEHIRQRALESSILRTDDAAPWLAPYQVLKLCEICNVLIGSEVYLLSHLRGRNHQEAVQKIHEGAAREEIAVLNIRHIVDAPADKLDPRLAMDKKRQIALKKRCKKIRQRMSQRGQEFESGVEVAPLADSANKQRLSKSLRDVDKLFKAQGKGQWPNPAITALERALGEINRILAKPGSDADQATFRALDGFTSVTNVVGLGLDVPPNMASYLPVKCFVTACTTLTLACRGHPINARYVLLSNKISTVLDLLLSRLSVLIPEMPSSSPGTLAVDALGDVLMRLLALVLRVATPGDDVKAELFNGRVQDVISYTVSVGVVDKLALYCGGVRDPIDGEPQAAQFLLSGLELLSTLTARCVVGPGKPGGRDPTQLLVTLQVTELVGAVSMLYGMLLHQGGPPRSTPPPPLPPHSVLVALATVHLLTRIAELDLDVFQSVLGAEGISLQFRHIASYLLWYCSHAKDGDELLHAVVKLVGFFAVNHRDNQMMLQSGYMPTVLQQLCNLPLPYFVNATLSAVLFPTLLACCVANTENRAILEQEISYQSLEEFKGSDVAQSNKLMQILACC